MARRSRGTQSQDSDRLWEQIPPPGPRFWVRDIIWRFGLRCGCRHKNVLLVGPTGCGKTQLAFELGGALNRTPYAINMGATTDARAALVGNTHFSDAQTQFHESLFVRGLQDPDALIILDEISRATLDASNILMPVLDHQRTIYLDEANPPRVVLRDENAIVIATMNIGDEYTGTRAIDRALKDRFFVLELDYPPKEAEIDLLVTRTSCSRKDSKTLVGFADQCRALWKRDELSTPVSTRMLIEAAQAIVDGFTLVEAVEFSVITFFDPSEGPFSERTRVREALQRL